MKPKMAHVICRGTSIEYVFVGNIKEALIKLNLLANDHYYNGDIKSSYSSYEEYRQGHHWFVRTVESNIKEDKRSLLSKISNLIRRINK